MELAFWQRYHHDDVDAARTVKETDEALSKSARLSLEDSMRIDAVRTRYALLGEPLPELKTAPITEPPKAKAKAVSAQLPSKIGPDYGAATVLVLFPDWCPQCRKMMKPLTEFGTANKDTPIYLQGLVFLEDPGLADPPTGGGKATHDQNLKEMEGTSTLRVDAKTAHDLGAVDFPFGIVLDHEGRVRYLGVLPGEAFNGNGYLEKVLARMAAGTHADARPAP